MKNKEGKLKIKQKNNGKIKHMSIVTLKITELNTLSKGRNGKNGQKKQDPTIFCLKEIYFH